MRPYQPRRVATVILIVLFMLCASAAQTAHAQAGARKRAGAAAGPRKGRAQTQVTDERARAFLEEGRRRADEGKWDEALQAYRQALAIDPRYGDAYIDMGDAYMSSGKYEEAFAAYEQAISVAPWNPDAHYSLGAAYNDMGNHGDAFKPFVQAIRLDPGFAEAHYGIGYAYLRLENFREALVYLRQAARLKPDYAEAHLALGQTQLGLRNMKAAEGELKVLADLDPTLARILEKDIREAAADAPEAARPDAPARSEQAATHMRPKPSTPDSALAIPYEGSSPQPTPPPVVKPKRAPAAATPSQPSAKRPAAPQTQSAAFELSFWESIKNSADPEEFAAYIKKYPDGQFVELARIRMRALEAKRGAAKDVEATPPPEEETGQQAAAAIARPSPEPARTPVPQPTPAPAAQQPSPPATVATAPPSAEQPSKPPAEQPAQVAAVAAQPLKEAPKEKEPVQEKKEPPVEVKQAAAAETDEAEAVTTFDGAMSLLRRLFPSRFTYRTKTAGGAASEVSINYEPLSFDNCQLSWRDSNDTLSVSLSDLDPGAVRVAQRVRPSTDFSVEVWDVTIATEDGKGAISEAKGDGSGAVNVYNGLDLQYESRQKADALAKALRGAIKLCTGKL